MSVIDDRHSPMCVDYYICITTDQLIIFCPVLNLLCISCLLSLSCTWEANTANNNRPTDNSTADD